MSAFGAPTFLGSARKDRLKTVTFTTTGTASYDTGGSIIDLSGLTNGKDRFFNKRVDGLTLISISVAASSKYICRYLGATPSTGVIKVHDSSAASVAEVTSTTSLAGTTFTFIAYGE